MIGFKDATFVKLTTKLFHQMYLTRITVIIKVILKEAMDKIENFNLYVSDLSIVTKTTLLKHHENTNIIQAPIVKNSL